MIILVHSYNKIAQVNKEKTKLTKKHNNNDDIYNHSQWNKGIPPKPGILVDIKKPAKCKLWNICDSLCVFFDWCPLKCQFQHNTFSFKGLTSMKMVVRKLMLLSNKETKTTLTTTTTMVNRYPLTTNSSPEDSTWSTEVERTMWWFCVGTLA